MTICSDDDSANAAWPSARCQHQHQRQPPDLLSAMMRAAAPSVHFCHGLESGPGGFKVRELRKQFTVCAPDMEMSLWNPFCRNSFARKLLLQWRWPSPAQALADSFAACVEVQRNAIRAAEEVAAGHGDGGDCAGDGSDAGPTTTPGGAQHEERTRAAEAGSRVLVGSSWGGAVAAALVADGTWPAGRPFALMCPALRMRERWTGEPGAAAGAATSTAGWMTAARIEASLASLPDSAKAAGLIIHGTDDDTIPLSDSRALADATDIALLEVDGGTHGLGAFVADGGLVDAIHRIILASKRN